MWRSKQGGPCRGGGAPAGDRQQLCPRSVAERAPWGGRAPWGAEPQGARAGEGCVPVGFTAGGWSGRLDPTNPTYQRGEPGDCEHFQEGPYGQTLRLADVSEGAQTPAQGPSRRTWGGGPRQAHHS